MTRTLILIPARGGSKGVPRKNLREVAGAPLLVWTVRQALAVADATVDVVVSTDDAEIAEVARGAGAQVPFLRPSHLARDESPTEDAVLHAIDEQTARGHEPERVLLLQPTSPVRRFDTLRRAFDRFESDRADSLVGVVPQSPFLWHATEPPTARYDVSLRPRRQELAGQQVTYRETGSLYLTRTEVYLRDRNRIGGKVVLFVMDEVEGTDIDTFDDLAAAEAQLLHLYTDGERGLST